jgi:hypothetical protein
VKTLKIMAAVMMLVFGLIMTGKAQEPLTNDSVKKLVRSGISEDLVVQTINTQPGNYSLGADDIVALKKAGVSDRIIGAMLSRSSAPAAAASAAPAATADAPASASGYPTEIGVYVKQQDQWVEVNPEIINWKSGGVFKTFATAGIVKGDLNGHIEGKDSKNVYSSPLEFCIYAPEGVAITEYQLLKLRPNKDYREFRTVTGGVLHQSGGATRDQLPFDGKKVASRTFVITLTGLSPGGEYGFLPPGAVTSSNSASIGKMYTFHFSE